MQNQFDQKTDRLLKRFAYINRPKDWATNPVIEHSSVEEIQESKQLENKSFNLE